MPSCSALALCADYGSEISVLGLKIALKLH
jgi:hypothetical protein